MTPAPVLVVDDRRGIRDCLEVMLEGEGFPASAAADGLQAPVRIVVDRPSVVIMDLETPVMTGWEPRRRLHGLAPNLPVIVMTGADVAGFDAGRLDSAAYVAKPFDADTLLLTALARTLRG